MKADVAEAIRWIRPAAEGGNQGALYYLGWMYDDSRAVAQDHKQGIKEAQEALKKLK